MQKGLLNAPLKRSLLLLLLLLNISGERAA
jgi:hypothetical protein